MISAFVQRERAVYGAARFEQVSESSRPNVAQVRFQFGKKPARWD